MGIDKRQSINGGAGRARVEFLTILAALLALLMGAGSAWAQSADPAATALQQAEQQAEALAQQARVQQDGPAVLSDPVARAELPPPGGPTVTVFAVSFEPASAFLSDAELDAIAASYIGRPLDFREISSLVRDVNDLYAERGIVTASAILPPQNLDGGILTVQLVEGRLGSVLLVGDHVTSNQFILNRIRLTTGDNVVDVPTAGRDLTYFNKTHRAQLRMLLQPGAVFGLTDIALGVTEPQRDRLTAFIDNQGPRSTGEVQVGFSWNRYGLAGIDDNLLLYLTASEGSRAGTISYDFPLTTVGTRLALGYTNSGIEVVAGPTAPLNITGYSQAATISLTQPFYADPDWLVQGLVSGSATETASFSAGVPLVHSDTVKAALGVALGYTGDDYGFSVQPQLVYAQTYDRLADTTRDMLILTASGGGFAQLGNDFHIEARGALQYTEEQLLPGNMLFQIGGPSTVRGYPSDGVAGDSGYFLQTELHWNGSDHIAGLGLFAFVDFGEVFSTFPARTTMLSAGAGARYNWNNHVSLDLSAGVPLIDAVANQADFTIYGRLTATF